MCISSFIRVFYATIILVVPYAFADSDISESKNKISVEALIQSLPAPSAEPLVINESNKSEYRSLIISELYELMRARLIELDALREPRGNLEQPKEAYKSLNDSDITSDGSLKNPEQLGAINIFSVDEALRKITDPEIFGRKILWNLQGNFFAFKSIDYYFKLLRFREDDLEELRAHIQRVYPRALPNTSSSNQFFREKFELLAPVAAKHYSWLTIRLFGLEEDAVWIYSPTIKKTRQVTGSNRADSFFGGFAMDDLFGISEKVELVTPVAEKTVTALVPIPALYPVKFSSVSDGRCKLITESAPIEGRSDRWNIETKHFPRGASWLPTHAVFVPKKLWKLELASKDPFSVYGRQVLYVDTETMLPAYKVVYDRGGKLLKIVMTAFGAATDDAGQGAVHFPLFTIIIDGEKKESTILDTLKFAQCEEFTDGASLQDFEPKRLSTEVN